MRIWADTDRAHRNVWIWGRYIAAPNAQIDIELSIQDIAGDPLATAGGLFSSINGGPFQSVVTNEFAANADLSPGSRDATLNVDLSHFQTPGFYFFDDSFEPDPAGLPFGQFDFLTVMVHEFAHILGVTIASSFETPFGALTEEIEGVTFFTGANGLAANGGNAIELIGSHLISPDLLDPVIANGERSFITPVHIGILQDIGIPIVAPSAGDDVLFGFELLDDSIAASSGNDLLQGLSGDDTLRGESDNDTLIGGAGADSLDGGLGVDLASYADAGVRVNLDLSAQGTAGDAAGDTFASIENVLGSDFDDFIVGNDGANLIEGGKGADRLRGDDGNDTLIGGAGADDMRGAAGVDEVSYVDALERVNLSLRVQGTAGDAAGDTFASIENVLGSDFDDFIFGSAVDNVLKGGAGDDRLRGHTGNDTLIGGAGADDLRGGSGIDEVNYEDATVRVNLNLLIKGTGGEAANDTFASIENVVGSDFNDYIFGSNVDNVLIGGGGADRLRGHKGNDTLIGGAGDDNLIGGTGVDEFVFHDGSDADLITDFQNNVDLIRLLDYGFATVADALAVASEVGSDVVFALGGSDVLTVEDVTINQLANDLAVV